MVWCHQVYGLILAEYCGPDISLHANVLRNFGQSSTAENSYAEVVENYTDRGAQAQEVFSLTLPSEQEMDFHPRIDIPHTDAPFVAARVKWFDKAKGFGFANEFGIFDDIFIHVEISRRFGFADLQPGEALAVRIVDGPCGKMAFEVRAWDYVQHENLD
ncbi:MAG: cold shock domain-containing protein [Rhodobacteraceae bacterium]|nr:cold shock domain-containing protein [Paracoccaceae bacterium]